MNSRLHFMNNAYCLSFERVYENMQYGPFAFTPGNFAEGHFMAFLLDST